MSTRRQSWFGDLLASAGLPWPRAAWGGPQEQEVLLLGLDAAGKTSLLYKLCGGGGVHTNVICIGCALEEARWGQFHFKAMDVGMGNSRIVRHLLLHHFRQRPAPAVVFVVDCSDRDRMPQAQEELHFLLDHEELSGDEKLLVLANKQDLTHAMGAGELAGVLELPALRQRCWHVQGCCALSGEGLAEGLAWLERAAWEGKGS